MHRDIYTALRSERCRELLAEAEQGRRARRAALHSPHIGRRVVRKIGSMMIATGSRLEQMGHDSKSVAYDMSH